MKKLYVLTALLLGMMSCTDETITYTNPVPGDEPSGITAELGISSKNTWFAPVDELNAAIGFKSLGGEVVVDIRTNTAWKYKATNADWLTIEKDDVADQLVLSCEGNKVEERQQATIAITAGDKTATIAVSQNPYGTLEIVASKNNFQLPAVGELVAEFEVQSTDEDWLIETAACPWMLLERSGDKITMTLDPNEEIEDREISFSLVAGEGGGSPVSETISVTQERAVFINVSAKTIPFSPTPLDTDRKELVVASNFDWNYVLSENSDWLTVTKTDAGLTLTAATNPDGSSRTATITVSGGDGKANVTEQVITVSQSGIDIDAFILGIDIASSGLTAYLPFDKAIDATIDWGDGTTEEGVTSTYPQHIYTDPGYYIVSVKGSVPSINSDNIPKYGAGDMYIEVYNWGRTGLTSMKQAFKGCGNLKRIPSDNTEAFAQITDFTAAFNSCEALEAIPEGLFDAATGVTTLTETFDGCTAITEVPAELLYNLPALTNVQSLLRSTSIAQIDENFFSHNPELTNASIIFSMNKGGLTTLPEKLFANNPKITTVNSLLANTATFESVPAGLFANNPVIDEFRMVFASTGLKSIPEGLFANNKEVTSFQAAFQNTKIQSIPADLFAGCDKVETFMTCFSGCSELQSIPADLFKNSGAMNAGTIRTGFNNIFKGCSSLTEIPAGLFDGFVDIAQLNDAFNGCTSLMTLPANLFATNTAVTQFSGTFGGCTSLKSIPEGLFRGLVKVTSFAGLFKGCEGLEEVGGNIIDGCTACTSISQMFTDCTNLKRVSADAFAGAPKISSIANLFENCTSLETVPEDLFAGMDKISTATSLFAGSGIREIPANLFGGNPAITKLDKAFLGCGKLTSLPDGLFAKNNKVSAYTSTFQDCTALESVGVLFGQNSTSSMKCDLMFAGCTSLKALPEGMFDGLTGATTFLNAFKDCSALETLPEGLFAKNVNVTTVATCFQNCTSLKAVPSRMFEANTKTLTLTQLFDGCTALESIAPDAFNGLNATGLGFMKMFLNCTALKEVPDGLFKELKISTFTGLFSGCTGLKRVGSEVFNCATTSSSITLTTVFDQCSSLEEIGEKMILNTAKLTSVSSLFRGCSSLKKVPVDIFDEAVKLKTLTSAFEGCTSLEGESPYTIVNGVKYHLYERTAENEAASGFIAVTGSKQCFSGCTKLTDYDKIPTVWKEAE